MMTEISEARRQEIVDLAHIVLRQHRRFGEIVYRSRNDLADEIVDVARSAFEDSPSPSEIAKFREEFMAERVRAEYYWSNPLVDRDFDRFRLRIGKPERYGVAIAKSLVYHHVLFLEKILLYADGIADTVLDFVRDGGLEDENVPIVLKHFARGVIGHERRHKIQDFFSKAGDGRDFLMPAEDGSVSGDIQAALEDDAEWFEERFMTWFWDGVDRLEDEERWLAAGKGNGEGDSRA